MSTPQPFTAFRDASTPCSETLAWLTDVQIARNGTDNARTQRRAYPRHSYAFDVVLTSAADKAALTALRTADTFTVPMWCHQFEAPETAPNAGVAASGPLIAQLNALSQGVFVNAADFVPSETYDLAMPAAVARPTDDSRTIGYVTTGIQRASVAFQLVDFKEVVAPHTGPTSGGLPTLTPFVPYFNNPEEQAAVNANVFDNEHLALVDIRYIKRNFSIDITLTSRAQILAFRQLLFALKGRRYPLRWSAPGEGESTWRLASDTVEIVYRKPNWATCRLALVQL